MRDNAARHILDETRDLEGARHLVDVVGLSSPKTCTLLNRLVASLDPAERYLEIGTWQGLTLCSAAYGNAGKECVACDKFRFLGRFTGWGHRARRALHDNVRRYREGSARVEFHHVTSRDLFRNQLVRGPIGVFFYDGDHSYEETHHALISAARLLSERATLLVDDYNDPVVREATEHALRDARIEVLWRRTLAGAQDAKGFWNGLGVFYVGASRSGAT